MRTITDFKMFHLWLGLFLALLGFAQSSHSSSHHVEFQSYSHLKRAANFSAEDTKSFKGLPSTAVEQAREVVDAALADWASYNKARFDNPRHNVYSPTPESVLGSTKRDTSDSVLAIPDVTEDIANAAALVAEIDAAAGFRNGTILPPIKKRAGTAFWMETISRSGSQPYGGDSSYKVKIISTES